MDNPNLDGYEWPAVSSGGINSLSDDDFADREALNILGDLYPEDDEVS